MTTLKEIQDSEKEMLIPSDIAKIINVDPQWIRLVARENPEKLGFPVMIVGNRVKIPRRPFLSFMTDGKLKKGDKNDG